jgi:hypothetical protein
LQLLLVLASNGVLTGSLALRLGGEYQPTSWALFGKPVSVFAQYQLDVDSAMSSNGAQYRHQAALADAARLPPPSRDGFTGREPPALGLNYARIGVPFYCD